MSEKNRDKLIEGILFYKEEIKRRIVTDYEGRINDWD